MAKKLKNRQHRQSKPNVGPLLNETLVDGEAGVSTETELLVNQGAELKTLGRYNVLGELGRGGMGTVYLAEDTKLKRKVALKIPQFHPSMPGMMESRIRREAEMAAQLCHPNICQIYDVGEIDGQYVMAMEYVAGKTLSEYSESGKLLSDRQVVRHVRKVALAVEVAHQKGMIHRDLKPGNIMLCRPDPTRKSIDPKVMDFGLVKRFEANATGLTKSGMIVGTPCYMSREQWSGRETTLGPPCDVYSLGIILYELLTGALPYDVHPEEPPTVWFVKLITESPTRPREHKPAICPALEQIVMKAIAVEVNDRYARMSELAQALESWLEGTTVSDQAEQAVEVGELDRSVAPETQSFETGRRPPISRKLISGFGGAAFVLLLAGWWFKFSWTPQNVEISLGTTQSTDTERISKDSTLPSIDEEKHGSVSDGSSIGIIQDVQLEPTEDAHTSLGTGRTASVVRGGGNWQVIGDELRVNRMTGEEWLLFGDRTWRDYTFTFECINLGRQTSGFTGLFRSPDDERIELFGISWLKREYSMAEYCQDGDWFRELEPVRNHKIKITANQWYRFRIEVVGTSAKFYCDDELVQETDRNPYESGRVGLRAYGKDAAETKWRNIQVMSADGDVLWSGPPDVSAMVSAAEPVTELAQHRDKTEFIPLLNGRTFDGWKYDEDVGATWTIQDGVIIGRGKRAALETVRRDFRHFEILAEIMLRGQVNSGLFFCGKNGFECELDIPSSGRYHAFGSLLLRGDVKRRRKPTVLKRVPLEHGAWIKVRIQSTDGRVVVDVNEQRVAEGVLGDGDQFDSIKFANWSNTGSIAIRQFLIREFD